MTKEIKITVADHSEPFIGTLLEHEAPKTCSAIWEQLPIRGTLKHAMYSGQESVTYLDQEEMLSLGKENYTKNVVRGDIGYYYSYWDGGEDIRTYSEFEEIIFIYGRNIELRRNSKESTGMNLIGEITECLSDFADISSRTREEGEKDIKITKK
jgi:hypothetical protein